MKRNPLDIKDVSKCTLCANLGKNHVPSAGNSEAEVMIIGQSPGKDEVKKGQPFVGLSGELVDWMLDEAMLNREDVYICNTLKCQPPGNRPGMKEEIETCKDTWLKHEIKAVDPSIIVVVGKDAFKSLELHKRTKFQHHHVIKSKKRTYIITYHPGYFLRNSSQFDKFVAVGETIKNALHQRQGRAE